MQEVTKPQGRLNRTLPSDRTVTAARVQRGGLANALPDQAALLQPAASGRGAFGRIFTFIFNSFVCNQFGKSRHRFGGSQAEIPPQSDRHRVWRLQSLERSGCRSRACHRVSITPNHITMTQLKVAASRELFRFFGEAIAINPRKHWSERMRLRGQRADTVTRNLHRYGSPAASSEFRTPSQSGTSGDPKKSSRRKCRRTARGIRPGRRGNAEK